MKILLLFLLFPFSLNAQRASVEEKKFLFISSRFNDTVRIKYPVVTLSNKKAAAQINKQIKEALFESYTEDNKNSRIDSMLKHYVEDWLTDLYYEINLNKNSLLSITF